MPPKKEKERSVYDEVMANFRDSDQTEKKSREKMLQMKQKKLAELRARGINPEDFITDDGLAVDLRKVVEKHTDLTQPPDETVEDPFITTLRGSLPFASSSGVSTDAGNPTKITPKIKPDFKESIHFGRPINQNPFVDVSIRKLHKGFGRKIDNPFVKSD